MKWHKKTINSLSLWRIWSGYIHLTNINSRSPEKETRKFSAISFTHLGVWPRLRLGFAQMIVWTLLRVTDSKYRESLDRFEKSKTLKLCLKNAFRELSSKMLFRFSKNSTPSRNSQKTKIHLFTSLNMQKISGKLTKFLVIALRQFTILEHGINLA